MTDSMATLARFVHGFPKRVSDEDILRSVSCALADTLGVAAAGHQEPAARIAMTYVSEMRAAREVSTWGGSTSLPPESAVLYNGIAGHVLDFDDSSIPLNGHPSIGLLPPLIALAELHGHTKDEVVASYIAGFEVMCKLARCMAAEHYATGWHTTTTIGSLSATVACAHLLDLNEAQVRNALGIALAQVSGTRASFGTMSKSLQAGTCGTVALRSSHLAQMGFTGAQDPLSGQYGFTQLYGSGEDLTQEFAELGSAPLEIRRSGLGIKKYPLCYATHRAIDATLQLRSAHSLSLTDVAKVDVRTSHRALQPLLYDHPKTALEGKFSMQYAIAAALLDGQVTLQSFTDDKVLRPEIQNFFRLVEVGEEDGQQYPIWCKIRIHTIRGATLGREVHVLKGSAEDPLTNEEVLDKVEACFAYGGLPFDRNRFQIHLFGDPRTRIVDLLHDVFNRRAT